MNAGFVLVKKYKYFIMRDIVVWLFMKSIPIVSTHRGVLCCVLADVESREDISQAECRPHHPTCRARCAPHRALVTQLASAVRGAARRGGDPDTVFLPAGWWLLVAGGHDLLQTFPTRRRDE